MQITITLPPELLEAIQNNTAAVEKFITTLESQAVLPKEVPAKPKKESAPKKEEAPVEDVVPEQEPVEEDKPSQAISLEVVRKKLAEISAQGKPQQLQVKEAMTNLGFKKLSDVPADKYGELLAAVGASE